ncbi:hypothetical protein [Metamycoplasma hyosynoviae]|uniref:hypothetical protein n=1 Tax=Metamycoplasma hyosynoviae TaxID=29559 RepID=UPI0023583157|nr:hypothetical protein [Metamycoplasma hyosynoviae]MDC8921007.1 hypothetical protein [Metamycoplasma hyosynoviae]MDD1359514.1 hypothetical protein [Metamycoplasma hyosynoviae]MDD1360869.1 hypothetical protein [Metamycoplasma hyosynoviae]MDD1361938.1 hypothetical protein [Metamycoplasma hyosynoviae]
MKNDIDFNNFNNKNKQEFESFLKNEKAFLSKEALKVLEYSLDASSSELKDTKSVDMHIFILQNVDITFTYIDQAFDYLKYQQEWDFKEAISNGLSDVCAIAAYYLLQEIEDFESKFIAKTNTC